jgi:hypothetical protein
MRAFGCAAKHNQKEPALARRGAVRCRYDDASPRAFSNRRDGSSNANNGMRISFVRWL